MKTQKQPVVTKMGKIIKLGTIKEICYKPPAFKVN
jgi:hypothetical protein